MAVELDVGDLVDGAVGGQDPLVVVAAEQCDLDLLALVLARVVLDGRSLAQGLFAPSRPAGSRNSVSERSPSETTESLVHRDGA